MKKLNLIWILAILLVPGVFAVSYSLDKTTLYRGAVTSDHPFAKAYEREVTIYSYTEFINEAQMDGTFDYVIGQPAPPLFTSIFTCLSPTSHTCFNSVFNGQKPAGTSFFIEIYLANDSDTKIVKEVYNSISGSNSTVLSGNSIVDYVRVPTNYPLVGFDRVTYKIYKDMSPFSDTTFVFGAGAFANVKVHAPTSDDGAVCKYLQKSMIIKQGNEINDINDYAENIYLNGRNVFDLNLKLFSMFFQIFKIIVFLIAMGALLYLLLFIVKLVKRVGK